VKLLGRQRITVNFAQVIAQEFSEKSNQKKYYKGIELLSKNMGYKKII